MGIFDEEYFKPTIFSAHFIKADAILLQAKFCL